MPVLHHGSDLKRGSNSLKGRISKGQGVHSWSRALEQRKQCGTGEPGDRRVTRTKSPGNEGAHIYGFSQNRGKMRTLPSSLSLAAIKRAISVTGNEVPDSTPEQFPFLPLPTCYCQSHQHTIILDQHFKKMKNDN